MFVLLKYPLNVDLESKEVELDNIGQYKSVMFGFKKNRELIETDYVDEVLNKELDKETQYLITEYS